VPTPRKALEVHKLQGTKPEWVVPDCVVEAGRPKFPKGISRSARKLFKKFCSLLEQRRSLTAGDGELIHLLVIKTERHQRAMEHLEVEGEIVTTVRLDKHGEQVQSLRPNQWLKIAQEAEKEKLAILDRLGLSPMNRSKVKSTEIPQAETPKDELENLLERNGEPASALAEVEDALEGLDEVSIH
jgi:P27 family predicted phage terminase small subunit